MLCELIKREKTFFANALYHSVINTDLDTDKKLFFLRLLSEYTLSHIKLLKYFSKDNFGPEDKDQKIGMGTIESIGGPEKPIDGIIEAIPELKGDPMFVKHIAGQLISDSMIGVIDFEMPVRKELARGKRITPYGKQFLDFIKGNSES